MLRRGCSYDMFHNSQINSISSCDSVSVLAQLRVENVKKKMRDFTLSAHFSIGMGERGVIVGKSGSGKTTLLRVLAGLETLDRVDETGKIYLGNQDLRSLSIQKREIGFIFQDQGLFLNLNVLENVTFALRVRGVGKKDREEAGFYWLEKMKLTSKVRSTVGELSGGEKQRVAFIRALIWKPKILLLDEPFSGLDPGLKEILRRELLDFHKFWPVPLLFVTHDPEDIDALATTRLTLAWDESCQVRKIVRDNS